MKIFSILCEVVHDKTTFMLHAIISISKSVSKGFLSKFPSLECKLILMENILSEIFIREQAELPFDTSFLQAFEGRERQTEHPVLLCTVDRKSVV